MFTTRYACINQTLSGSCLLMKWVYVWLFFVYCAQLPHNAACSWFDRIREAFTVNLRGRREYEALRGDDYPEPAPAPDAGRGTVAGEGSSPDERDIEDVYTELLDLRENFRSMVAKEPQPDWVVQEGLNDVRRYTALAAGMVRELCERDDRLLASVDDRSKFLGLVPDGHSVDLMSAATGAVEPYMFKRRRPTWIIENTHGEVFEFSLWSMEDRPVPRRKSILRVPGLVANNLQLAEAFGVSSARILEREFGLEVVQDVLTHPSGGVHLPFPSGMALNFVTLWRPVTTSLNFLGRALYSHSTSAAEARHSVLMARYNLTYQLIYLIGRVTRRGVSLDRFCVSDFLVRSAGIITLRVNKASRKKTHHRRASESTAGAQSAGASAEWPSFDPIVNAWDLARAIIFVWCSNESADVSIYTSSPSHKDIMDVVGRCRNIPEEVRQLIRQVFEQGADASQILSCNISKKLHRRLVQLARDESQAHTG